MRRVVVCIWVLLASAALPCAAQSPATAAGQGTQAGDNQKIIHDPAEYNAYISALNTQDPTEKAAAMEAFVAGYPGSVMQEDALEQALVAYQMAGKPAEVERIANRILQLNGDNVRALAIIVALTRNALTQGKRDLKVADLRVLAERGLRAMPQRENPDGMAQNDFEKLRKQMAVIFYGGAGFAALEEKEYTTARDYYSKAQAIEPNDLQNIYQLSVADLEMANPDIRGFWYVARAIHVCEKQNNTTAARSIAAYGQAKYKKYHGSEEGWQELLRRATTAADPPRDFQVMRAVPPSAGPSGTSASLTSNSSPGSAHSASASILSADRASAGIPSTRQDPPRGASASLLSADSSGTGHSVPASVLSAESPGTGHKVPASITSSAAVRSGRVDQKVPASILHTASASVLGVSRGISALSKSLVRRDARAQPGK